MDLNRAVLKKIFTSHEESVPENSNSTARVIAITSGKGGVGKTNITANLGIALAKNQKRVCIIDGDLGLANINIILGKYPKFTIEDILSENRTLEEVLFQGPEGIDIIPGATALGKITDISNQNKHKLLKLIEELENRYDFILIDTSAGINETVLSFIQMAHETIIAVTPEPTSLTDAYSLVKVLKTKGIDKSVYTLINMVLSYEDSVKIYNRFNATTKKFLNFEMKYLGYIMMDQIMVTSVIQQRPVMVGNPESVAGHCFTSIADKFISTFTFEGGSTFSEHMKKIAFDNGTDSFVKETENKIPESTSVKPEKDLNENVVTVPAEVRQHYNTAPKEDKKELLKKIVRMIETNEIEQDEAKEFVQQIENLFVKKFETLPYDIKQSIYLSLNLSNFSENNIKELALNLESIYLKRANRQLFDLDDIFMKSLEENSISELKMRTFIDQLKNSFERLFKKRDYDLNELLEKDLASENISKEDFEKSLDIILKAHEKRFGKPLKICKDFPETEVNEMAHNINEKDEELKDIVRKVLNIQEENARLKENLMGTIYNYLKS